MDDPFAAFLEVSSSIKFLERHRTPSLKERFRHCSETHSLFSPTSSFLPFLLDLSLIFFIKIICAFFSVSFFKMEVEELFNKCCVNFL